MSSERAHLEGDRLPPGERHALPDPRRAEPDQLRREIALVRDSPVVSALLQAIDTTLLVLNPQRQVVACNGPPGQLQAIAGLRPGDLLGCLNARSAGGCGTTAACATCGALGAILGSEHTGRPVGADFVLSTDEGGPAREFDVRATPVLIEGLRFTVVSLRDVTVERRREALEQVFFHDVLNTVSAVRGWAAHLTRRGSEAGRAGERLDVLGRRLEREIRDHRALVLAEAGSLVPEPARVDVRELIEEVVATLSQHPSAQDRAVQPSLAAAGLEIETDPALLARVLVNMVRNALEATPPGGTVRLECEPDEPVRGGVRVSVHNDGVMTNEVQARIFQRSFSTKGRGRGFGTYGMKLVGERYLGGTVWFVSTPEAGTTFSIRVPPRLPQRADDGARVALPASG